MFATQAIGGLFVCKQLGEVTERLETNSSNRELDEKTRRYEGNKKKRKSDQKQVGTNFIRDENIVSRSDRQYKKWARRRRARRTEQSEWPNFRYHNQPHSS